ncbi:uncharacterized protein LOC144702545 [Wolffia australiana]
MEDLIGDLNSSMRLARKIGESSIVQIIGTAMEESYKRILRAREGSLDSLNEKSRLCGLAIVQIDWSLRLMEEEMEAGSNDEREELVHYLQATRDRFCHRMEVIKIAITDKEREIINLRHALESKDEELRSLRSNQNLNGDNLLVFNMLDGDEHHLLGSIEKEVTHILIENFIRHVNEEITVARSCQVALEESKYDAAIFMLDEDPLASDDEVFCSARVKLEKALQQMAMTRVQLQDFGSDLGLNIKDEQASNKKERVCVVVESKEDDREERKQSMASFIHSFSQCMVNLEQTTIAKAHENLARLEEFEGHLERLARRASSLRGSESVYRMAFIRRCYNLRTAEAEVDLLGDEVDMLVNLLEKIYIVLDHYSPILKYYEGVSIFF